MFSRKLTCRLIHTKVLQYRCLLIIQEMVTLVANAAIRQDMTIDFSLYAIPYRHFVFQAIDRAWRHYRQRDGIAERDGITDSGTELYSVWRNYRQRDGITEREGITACDGITGWAKNGSTLLYSFLTYVILPRSTRCFCRNQSPFLLITKT